MDDRRVELLSLHEVRSFLRQAEAAVDRLDRQAYGDGCVDDLREAIDRCRNECERLLRSDSEDRLPSLFEAVLQGLECEARAD